MAQDDSILDSTRSDSTTNSLFSSSCSSSVPFTQPEDVSVLAAAIKSKEDHESVLVLSPEEGPVGPPPISLVGHIDVLPQEGLVNQPPDNPPSQAQPDLLYENTKMDTDILDSQEKLEEDSYDQRQPVLQNSPTKEQNEDILTPQKGPADLSTDDNNSETHSQSLDMEILEDLVHLTQGSYVTWQNQNPDNDEDGSNSQPVGANMSSCEEESLAIDATNLSGEHVDIETIDSSLNQQEPVNGRDENSTTVTETSGQGAEETIVNDGPENMVVDSGYSNGSLWGSSCHYNIRDKPRLVLESRKEFMRDRENYLKGCKW